MGWHRGDIQILYTIPFSSDRKRMSVLCKMPDGRFRVICKGTATLVHVPPRVMWYLTRPLYLHVCVCVCAGWAYGAGADNVVLARLADGQTELKAKTEDHLLNFSREGLRTLCYAHRELEADHVVRWVQSAEEGTVDTWMGQGRVHMGCNGRERD